MVNFAISSWCGKYPDDLLDLATATGFSAIEWDLNYIPLPLSRPRRTALLGRLGKGGVGVRYHLPHSTVDIGSRDPETARVSETFLAFVVSLLGTHGPFHAVLHVGSEPDTQWGSVVPALARLVEHAKSFGGTIAVENLMTGPTAHPLELRSLAEATGATVALDVGHARGLGLLDEFLASLATLITHVHFYAYEDDRRNHLPFDDPQEARDVAAAIEASAHPAWWTFEMDSRTACLANRRMLQTLPWARDHRHRWA